MGLAVAWGLTEAMGGRLAIEATPGGGTTVVVGPHRGSDEEPTTVERARRAVSTRQGVGVGQ